MGDFEEASRALNEALRLSAEVQQTELQLIATYNLGHLARERGDFRRAHDTYELAMELAERIDQSEVQTGALAGMALCKLMLGDVANASHLRERLLPLAAAHSDWFQGRELVEALPIHLALLDGKSEAFALFQEALALAEARDVYGAIWLIAQFESAFRDGAPEEIHRAVRRSANRPEVRCTEVGQPESG
jgi:tetratricopeptide (TPR) repeat protein